MKEILVGKNHPWKENEKALICTFMKMEPYKTTTTTTTKQTKEENIWILLDTSLIIWLEWFTYSSLMQHCFLKPVKSAQVNELSPLPLHSFLFSFLSPLLLCNKDLCLSWFRGG